MSAKLPDDGVLVEALRRGEEGAFDAVVKGLHERLLWVARSLVRNPETAREVVQDTWLAVIDGIGAFEGRSKLKSWIFGILVRRARTRAGREWRQVPFSAVGVDDAEPLIRPALFEGRWLRADAFRWEPNDPERMAMNGELVELVRAAIETLPDRQRAVVVLRDVEAWTARRCVTSLP